MDMECGLIYDKPHIIKLISDDQVGSTYWKLLDSNI